jgi:uncharacterized protein
MNDDSPEQLNPSESEAAAGSDPGPEFTHSAWPSPSGSAFPPDIFGIPTPPPRIFPRRIPNFGHVILFFVLALILLGIGQLLGVFLLQLMHFYPRHSFDALFLLSSTDARASIPIQTLSYALIALVAIPVFSVLWNEPFSEGVHWDNRKAQSRSVRLAALGLAAGFGISFLGNYLPMPPNPPITQDMMKSAAGAWMMMIFGLTAAPLLEELAFRGFLLPGILNSFRWFADRGAISEKAANWIGIPISILLTSIGFACMHSPQVSHAWGPLLLIGSVSVVLCIVRLVMNSVAAGVIVHSAYNFTLFAGVFYQTAGFRHLERLTS